jgi:predicted transcriptional regulator
MAIKEENYITIQGWMISRLGLKGNELLIYAIIYGFSQTEGQVFSGSLRYLAEWTNSTKQGVIKSLKSLVEKGCIGKQDRIVNGVKFCEYYATKFNGVVNKVDQGGKQSLMGGIKQSLPNNINIDNIENNKEYKRRFTPPTLKEVTEYCLERKNTINPQQFVDFYTAKGWKVGNTPMKDWKAAVRTWEQRDFGNRKQTDGRFYKSEPVEDDLPF